MIAWYADIPDRHPYRVKCTKCCIDTVISSDDGHIVARSMWRKEINIPRKIVHQVGFIYKDIQQVDISLITIACGGRHVIELFAEAV